MRPVTTESFESWWAHNGMPQFTCQRDAAFAAWHARCQIAVPMVAEAERVITLAALTAALATSIDFAAGHEIDAEALAGLVWDQLTTAPPPDD